MDSKQFESIIELKIRDIVAIIIDQKQLPFNEAIQYVYESKLYPLLTDETTKLWHLSAIKLVGILIDEKECKLLNLPDYV